MSLAKAARTGWTAALAATMASSRPRRWVTRAAGLPWKEATCSTAAMRLVGLHRPSAAWRRGARGRQRARCARPRPRRLP
eukprot:1996803-Prymnesium_polylepis.1